VLEKQMVLMNFKKRIIATSLIAGVLPAAYLVTRYSHIDQTKVNPANIKTLGLVLSIASYLSIILVGNKLPFSSAFFESNPFLAYGLALLTIVGIQSVATLFFIGLAKVFYGKNIFTSAKNLNSKSTLSYTLGLLLSGLLITASLYAFGTFVFIVFAIYFVPSVYLYNKIKPIFKTKKQTILFSILFVLIVLMFPLTRFLDAYIETAIVRFMTLLGYYYAPALLYLVLFYVAFDLIQLILKISRPQITKMLNTQRSKTVLFLTLFALTLLIEARGIYNFNTPKIQEYQIQVPKKSAAINHLKIAMAADFHFSEITSPKFVTKFVNKVNATNADIVLFPGDIFESNNTNAKLDFIKNELKGIKSKYGVYAVEGNHGYYSRTNTEDFFSEAGISLLQDTVISIDNSFQIMGRMDRHNRNRSSLSELLAQTKAGLPLITMDHQPYYEDKNFGAIDVYLSGHTHNGQLFPANLIEKLIYELPWGYKKINSTHLFVTCGAQGWGPQVRTASQSEIMLINIEFVSD
jgi:predicted MPP superfamily phosphohydrolase